MTCFGINNEGKLVFDYYHEDTDKLDKANVYNGQESTLWVNFREAFPDKIQETYQSLRNDGKLTYDVLVDRFITQGSNKWSANMYNEDAEFKYVSMLKSSNDATNLPQVRGSGEEHFKYFVDNRLNYCDGKWYASDYADDYVSFRIYTPDTWAGVEPNANITVTPFSNMYAGVRYKANGTLQQAKVEKNTAYTFIAPDETFNDTETAVYGVSQISSFGDLSPLYAGTIDVSKATKLVELHIGSDVEGYSNTNMHALSVGTNRLLKKIDIRNCPNLTDPLDLTGCPNIEEIYATGTGITGIELAESGYVRTMQLPGTLTNLTIMNQLYVEDFSMEGYDALKTLRIENCSSVINPLTIVTNSPNLERIRITDAKLSYETYSEATELHLLYNYKGLDENGHNTDTAHISGTCHIATLTGAEYAEIVKKFPYLTITYTNLTSQLIFMSEDGTTELGRQTIANGGNGKDPIAAGLFSAPTKASTAQYTYSLDGWSLKVGENKSDSALLAVTADRYVYAHFAATVRRYTVYFYNGATLLQTVSNVPYGGTATYTGAEPIKPDVDESEVDDYPFTGWSPSPSGITGDTRCYAQFSAPYELKEITDNWETILYYIWSGAYENVYKVGNYKPLDLGSEGIVNMQIAAINTDDKADGSGKAPITWISKELLAKGHKMNQGPQRTYTYVSSPSWEKRYSTSYDEYRQKTIQAGQTSTANFTITIQTDGKFNFQIITSTRMAPNGTAVINGVVQKFSDVDSSGNYTEMDVVAGDVITIEITYTPGDELYYAIFEIFKNSTTATYSVSMECNDCMVKTQNGYVSGTGAIGGWEHSEMRTYLKDTIKPLIPEMVRDNIVEVTKSQLAYDTTGAEFTQTTADDVWIPSGDELVDGTYKVLFPDNESRIKSGEWWTRDAGTYDVERFCKVNTNGTLRTPGDDCVFPLGVVLSFCTKGRYSRK